MKIIDSTIKLKSWQIDAYKWYLQHPTGGVLVINSCRQTGKSTTLGLIALKASLENSNSDTYIVSPTLNQSRHMFKTLSNYIKDIPCYDNINKQLLNIEFKNGSSINFKSAEQSDGLRGFTCKGKGLLICDEAAFLKEDTFPLILPYTNVNNNSIIYASTPLFRDGWFWQQYNSNDSKITVIDTAKYDLSMFITEERKQLYKSSMPYQQYLREIEGMFIELSGEVFGEFKDVVNDIFDNSPCEVVSIDWSTLGGNDYTAVTALNEHKQMILCEYWNLGTPQDSIDRIVGIINKLNPKHIIVEKNSIGNVFGGLLKKAINKPIKYFVTTNDSKNRIINQLQVAIQKKDIQLLNDKELLNELVSYQIEKTNSGKITFNAKAGHHDDIIMSLAIGLDKFIHKGNINLA